MSNTQGPDKNDKKKFNPFDDMNKMNGSNQKFNLFRGAGIVIMFFVILVMMYMFVETQQKPEYTISYSQYKEFLDSDMIESAVVTKSQLNYYEFKGTLKETATVEIDNQTRDIKYFITQLGVLDNDIEQVWRSKGIDFTYINADSGWWGQMWIFLPMLAILFFYIFIFRRMQGGGGNSKGLFSFGKSRARLMQPNQSRKTFQDVAGADEAKQELEEIIEFLREPEKFQRLGGRIPKGVLLLGQPGTGKTLLAKAVAGEAEVPFFSISGADFVEMFVGVGASRVRDLFEQAKKNSPCLIFIDEIDAVGRQRGAGLGGGHDEREQTLNQLLVEMDGFEENNGIIIIAATNRPDVLDPALLRPGRFDRQVVVDKPDVRGREGIFKVHTREMPLGDDVELEILAKGTPGLSGADIANIVNEAALLGARRNSDKVTMYDFENAKDKVLMGIERKSMVISEKEKEMTAYHEMGHALVGLLIPNGTPVHKVTIIPRGRALGVTQYIPQEDTHSQTDEFLIGRLTALLAGRAAEKLVFNKLTNGAAHDLEHATAIARKMVCDWGMSEAIGPIKFSNNHDEVFLGREISQPPDHSEKTQQLIDQEIMRLLNNADSTATKLLSDNIELLHTISKILITREVLDAEELQQLLKGEELPPLNKQTLNALKSIKIDETIDDDTDFDEED